MSSMRGLACLLLLAGCDQVFGFDELEPVNTLCLGRNGDGSAGLFDHCLSAQPPADLTGVIDIDTDDDTMCAAVVAQGDMDRSEVCVVAARNIEINAFVFAHGRRPLVLAAIETFTITTAGTVSVASMRRTVNGAGANFSRCANALAGANATNQSGGAGGAGGSFQTVGGAGGGGNGNNTSVQPRAELEPGFVRGGCPGGGGGNAALANGGGRGAGGGAVYVMAGREIRIEGTVNASGESGGGGAGGTGSTSGGAGGGGGGAGGLIGLDAPFITLGTTAILIANGGGGGGGGSSTQPGKNGAEADATTAFPFAAAGGDGGSNNTGGRGGGGAAAEMAAGAGATYTTGFGGAAGGGGGGGGGYVKLFGISVTNEGAAISPGV